MFKSWIKPLFVIPALIATVCAASPPDGDAPFRVTHCPRWSVDDLFTSPTPFALGHRGYGANPGTDPNRPIEDTKRAFKKAFRDGIRIVELDLQQTKDGKIVVFHDDVLEDQTCVSALTYEELQARKPYVPLFRGILKSLRRFGHAEELSGIIFAEIKVPIPFCDGANTSAEAAVSESKLVAAVIGEIRRAGMEDQVIINSGSPTILRHAALQAPEIKRALTLNVLQLLPPQVVEQILHVPVVLIPKNDFGLAWYNVGAIARLPAMPSAAGPTAAFQHFVGVSLAVGSRAVSLDKQVLQQAGAGAPSLIAGVHGAGLKAIVWTVDDAQEWAFVAQAGVDGITTNNIALGLSSQAPSHALIACEDGEDEDSDDGDSDHHKDKGKHKGKDKDKKGKGHGRDSASLTGEPVSVESYRAYPNPFTSRMQFAYTVSGGDERVEIGVYDLAGRLQRKLASGYEPAGRHEVTWDGTNAAGVRVQPGVFFLRGTVGGRSFGMRLLYVR